MDSKYGKAFKVQNISNSHTAASTLSHVSLQMLCEYTIIIIIIIIIIINISIVTMVYFSNIIQRHQRNILLLNYLQ